MACEMILSGGGTTVWESAALGAPMMLVASAPEEEAAAKHLSEAGLCHFLGPVETLDAAQMAAAIDDFADDLAARARSSTLGRELVDGLGAKRVIEAIQGARLIHSVWHVACPLFRNDRNSFNRPSHNRS